LDDTPSRFLRQLKSRDAAAWAVLRDIYGPFIQRQLRRMISDPAAADEILQDVLVVVHEKIAAFQPERIGSFRTYLRSIARYQCLAYLKKYRGGAGAHGSGDSAMAEALQQWADPASDLSRMWDDEHRELWSQRLLLEAKRRLGDQGERDIEIFTLLHREEIPRPTIAERCGVSVSYTYKVQNRVSALLEAIRQEWAGLIDAIDG
jgi:RNA polymerase sigma factor (sigma-70 family)